MVTRQFTELGYPIATTATPAGTVHRSYEDALDALVCCWIGSAFLAGEAYPLGDETAAIWCPEAIRSQI